jgi:ketosteroid isomerase-like protein
MSLAGEITETEVELQVRRAAQSLIDATLAGDVETVLSAYRQDTPFIEQGRIRARFDELEAQIREFFELYRVIEHTLDDIRIVVLSENAAILTARYSYSTLSKVGSRREGSTTNLGAWSAVFVSDPSGWRIVVPHQSSPHPIP